MKHLFATLFFAFIGILCFNLAKANHIYGTEIRYKSVGVRLYEVTLKMYRECSGVPLCGNCNVGPTGCTQNITVAGIAPPAGLNHNLPSQSCNGVNYGTYSLPIASGANAFDVVQLCNLTKSICTNCNTRAAGTFSPGIEVYIFKGTINLSALPSTCCWVSIGTTNICCRAQAITTITNPGAVTIFADSKLNICLNNANEAPVFLNEATPIVSAGSDNYINLGAFDPDGDSLSYRLGTVESSRGVGVPYSTPYSQEKPFPYLGFPNTSPPLLPPLGININPVTGLIIFRTVGSFVSVLSIEVLEWRKINNIITLIGITKREVNLHSGIYINTNKPGIRVYHNGSVLNTNTLNICNDTQICLDVISPSSGWAGNDTTDLEIIFGSNNATATITRPYDINTRSINGPKFDTLKVCINGLNNNSNFAIKPYLVHIKAKNRFCPLNEVIIRSIVINKLSPLSNISMVKQTKYYGLPIFARINLNGNPSFVRDSTQWFVETSPGSNNFVLAATGTDTINNYTLNQGGWHKIRASLYSTSCERVNIVDSVFGKYLTLDIIKTNPEKCVGDSNGQVIFSRLGGVGATMVSLQKTNAGPPFYIPWAQVDTFSNLTKDSYILRMIDSIGNKDSILFSINRSSTPYIASTPSITHVNCFGDSTGAVTLNFSGGDSLGIRLYSIDSINWQVTNQFNNLVARPYRFLVKDSSNCRGAQNVTVNQSSEIISNAFLVQPIKCKGDSNAAVVLQTTGGTFPYQAKFEQGNFASVFTFTNLKANSYQITIKDNKGCLKTLTANVPEPATRFSGDIEVTQPICNALPGAANLQVTGGIPPYQYWLFGSTPNNNPTINNISAGNKIAYARDSNQCVLTFNFTINNPLALTLGHTKTDINCYGGATGSIRLSPSGGIKPYLFKINNQNFQSDSIFLNLQSGSYTISVKDSLGCLTNAQTNLNSRPALVTSIVTTPESCNGAKNGTATMSVSGGVAPYVINWQTNPPFIGNKVSKIGNGKYYVTVLDYFNCQKTDSFQINFIPPFAEEVICAAGYKDAASKIDITWKKTPGNNIKSYKIFYQYDIAGAATELATIPFSAPSLITDSVSTKDKLVFYRISAIDSCGNPSSMSPAIAAPFLQASKNGNQITLNWNHQNYPSEVSAFKVFKSINNGPFTSVASINLPNSSFNDSMNASNLRYYIAADSSNCNPGFNIQSNQVEITLNGLESSSFANNQFSLFPNPTKQKVNILSKGTVSFNIIKIYGLQGNLIQTIELDQSTQSYELNLPELAKGMYYISLSNKQNSLISLPLWVE
jgi:hypothetical protein